MSSVLVRAPSNIALVKYMGKDDPKINVPSNGSLSMTLSELCSFVEFRAVSGSGVSFGEGLPDLGGYQAPDWARVQDPVSPKLSHAGVERMLAHVRRVRGLLPEVLSEGESEACFEIRSANTFPASSGIASSASAFAAVTLATVFSFARDRETLARAFSDPVFKRRLAWLSRQGSGSSCRSFEGPWVQWGREDAVGVTSKLPAYSDFVLVVGAEEKEVSSSDAHLRVKTSPLWEGRTDRAEERLKKLSSALMSGDAATVALEAWAEAWEMHSLFHTSEKPFTYWLPGSVHALRWARRQIDSAIERRVPPPIVTMDAGPNVHFLVPTSEESEWFEALRMEFPGKEILLDRQGGGAEVLRGASG